VNNINDVFSSAIDVIDAVSSFSDPGFHQIRALAKPGKASPGIEMTRVKWYR
jgi:hypothetical protein